MVRCARRRLQGRLGGFACAALCGLAAAPAGAWAESVPLEVSGPANIYAAGQSVVPRFSGGGGTLPVKVPLPAGSRHEVTFADVRGLTDCDTPGGPISPPDGSCFNVGTFLDPWGGISGMRDASADMFLVGVFIGDAPPATPPPTLDFGPPNSDGTGGRGHDFFILEPALGQQFFIGDGVAVVDDVSRTQRFVAPEGATALYLGFADGANFRGTPGYYDDNFDDADADGRNDGTLTGTATITVPDTTAPAAPVISSPVDGSWDRDGTVVLAGSAEAGSSVEVYEGSASHGSTIAARDGSWSLTVSGLADGDHMFTAKATDAAGNTSPASAPVTVRVDTVAPETTITAGPEGATGATSPSFEFGSSEGGSSFECRLDGPAGAGSYEACSSPKAYSGLADGVYTFMVRASDQAGNVDATAAARSFTVDTRPTATSTTTTTEPPASVSGSQDPPPPASVSGSQDPPPPDQTTGEPPPPQLGQSVNVAPVKGTILVRIPGTNRFRRLRAGEQIPMGSLVDARKGTVRLVSARDAKGAEQSGSFWAGVFRVTQTRGTPAKGRRRAQPPMTVLTLKGSLAGCPRRTTRRSARRAAAAKRRGRRGAKKRRLWGSGRGNFRTSGRYSSAAVRGTKWLTEDRCASTVTRVTEGRVAVRDRVRAKTVMVRAGQRYVAGARRR